MFDVSSNDSSDDESDEEEEDRFYRDDRGNNFFKLWTHFSIALSSRHIVQTVCLRSGHFSVFEMWTHCLAFDLF